MTILLYRIKSCIQRSWGICIFFEHRHIGCLKSNLFNMVFYIIVVRSFRADNNYDHQCIILRISRTCWEKEFFDRHLKKNSWQKFYFVKYLLVLYNVMFISNWIGQIGHLVNKTKRWCWRGGGVEHIPGKMSKLICFLVVMSYIISQNISKSLQSSLNSAKINNIFIGI